MGNYQTCIGMFGFQDLCGGDAARMIEMAQMADAAGIGQMNFTDHVIMSDNTDKYPFGDFPVPPDYPWFEPMVMMSAMAGATRRIRLATGVLIAPLRPAALLAKMAATLDVVSGGRLDLGIGVGWQSEEYEACGFSYEACWEMLDEQVRLMHQLWSEAPVSFSSPKLRVERLYSLPHPLQEGGVPLWYGVRPTPENAKRIAEFGQGWVPIRNTPQAIGEGVGVIREAFQAAGRDPDTLRVRVVVPPEMDAEGRPDIDRALGEHVGPLLEAGATHLEFMTSIYVHEFQGLGPFFEKLAQA